MSVATSATTPAGSYTLTITGIGGSNTRTTAVTVVVQAASGPDYSLSASPSSHTVVRGARTSYTVTITRSGGFTGPVTLSVSGLPGGVGATFRPNTTTGAGSTMSVTTRPTTSTGSYSLTITGVSGSLTRTVTVTLVITSANDCGNC